MYCSDWWESRGAYAYVRLCVGVRVCMYVYTVVIDENVEVRMHMYAYVRICI